MNFTAENLIYWFVKSKGWENMGESEFNEYYNSIHEFQRNFKVEIENS